MTQRAMCELYQVAKSSVSEHIAHIFEDGELEQQATVREFRTVQEVFSGLPFQTLQPAPFRN